MDDYEILGIERNASLTEIKKAFRKEIKKNHPDLHKGDASKLHAEERTKQIINAYKRLKDKNYKFRDDFNRHEQEQQENEDEERKEEEKRQYEQEQRKHEQQKREERFRQANSEDERLNKKNKKKPNNIYSYEFCKACGDKFIITKGEYKFYMSKGLDLPKRCKSCREDRVFKSYTKAYRKPHKMSGGWIL